MNFLSLRGHDAVCTRLADALARDRLAHALLFTGPPGIGKSLAARWLVARVACRRSAAAPCGECGDCLQVAAGTHADLQWIAPAAGKKEIGIDLARRLKRFVQMRTVRASRKMAVVDDADRLSIPAQNALLKTLEEPPGSALIIIVTASPGALLTTVRSRCQRVLFHPLGDDDVTAVLEAQLQDADRALQWVGHADGSPGRALVLQEVWKDEDRDRLLGLLADLGPGRYSSIVAMSRALGRTESELAARLEALLDWYRTAADRAVGGESGPFGLDVERAVRGADVIDRALRTLRRRNPNRPLLADALLLRLARL